MSKFCLSLAVKCDLSGVDAVFLVRIVRTKYTQGAVKIQISRGISCIHVIVKL